MSEHALMLAAVAAAATMLIAGSTLAAETAKEGTYSGKIDFKGKFTEKIRLGEFDQYWAVTLEEHGTSSGDQPVKSQCLGVGRDINGEWEVHSYCVDTDVDGDQILWKLTDGPRRFTETVVTRTEEALTGTGKYSGRSATQTLNCVWTVGSEDETSIGWKCEIHGDYKQP